MRNPSPEEENIIKDIRNLFRFENLKKEITDTTKKSIKKIEKYKKSL